MKLSIELTGNLTATVGEPSRNHVSISQSYPNDTSPAGEVTMHLADWKALKTAVDKLFHIADTWDQSPNG